MPTVRITDMFLKGDITIVEPESPVRRYNTKPNSHLGLTPDTLTYWVIGPWKAVPLSLGTLYVLR